MQSSNQARMRTPAMRGLMSGLFAAIPGAIGGAFLAQGLIGSEALAVGALAGALLAAIVGGIGEARSHRGEPIGKPYRVILSIFFGATLGGLLGWLFPEFSVGVYGLILGFLAGISGIDARRLVLGLLVGGSVAGVVVYLPVPGDPALLGALIFPISQMFANALGDQEDMVRFVGEQVDPDEAKYVVPFEAATRSVGAGYFEELARETNGSFKRNAPGIGVVQSLDSLEGSTFDPGRVHREIRNFYEHTSEYSLDIVPEWVRRYQALFLLFKRTVAQPMGQANLPFNTAEAQRGIVSYIDSIDFDSNDIVDLRGWVRAFEETGEAIYVGIYTTFREDNVGYVSVGFPLPKSNFTATLLPFNDEGAGLVLKTQRTGRPYPGHYLTEIEEDGSLHIVKLPTFGEEIQVYMDGDRLKTDHRFYISGRKFLTLHYSMNRRDSDA